MPETKTPEDLQKVEEQKTQDEATKVPEAPEASEPKDDDLWAGVPEEHPVRDLVRSLRSESASKRTENRSLQEIVDQLKADAADMKTPEEFQKAIDESNKKIREANLTAARERAGRTHGLPESLIPRLAGETEEEVLEDAERLKADLGLAGQKQGPPKPSPQGGKTPGTKGLNVEQTIARLQSGGRSF